MMRGRIFITMLIAGAMLLLIVRTAMPVSQAGDRDAGLQRVFDEFPRLKPKTNGAGELVFQTIALDHPVSSIGTDYYGFRFEVPERTNHENLVWVFGEPQSVYHWYIVPKTDSIWGFNDCSSEPRKKYQGMKGVFPRGPKLVLQELPGDRLEDGKEYLIWFTFSGGKPAKMSLKFTFADLGSSEGKKRIAAMEKVLSLERVKNSDPK